MPKSYTISGSLTREDLKRIQKKIMASGFSLGVSRGHIYVDAIAEANRPRHLYSLEAYLKDKEDTGAVSGVASKITPRVSVLFDTTMGFMRKVVGPWLWEYAKTWRLCVYVYVGEPLAIVSRNGEDLWFGSGHSRPDQLIMPPDCAVTVMFIIKARPAGGTVRFTRKPKKQYVNHKFTVRKSEACAQPRRGYSRSRSR